MESTIRPPRRQDPKPGETAAQWTTPRSIRLREARSADGLNRFKALIDWRRGGRIPAPSSPTYTRRKHGYRRTAEAR
jgi:hypothetical protein